MFPIAPLVVLCWTALVATISGCGVRTPLDVGMDGSVRPPDAMPAFDGATCITDADCDDGRMCNGLERCWFGRCVVARPTDCDDGIDCTVDECIEGRGCLSSPRDSLCPSGSRCDPRSGCVGGRCVSDADCDDGVSCNGLERCGGGTCVFGDPPACDDGIACTVDSCEEPFGTCTSEPDSSRCPAGAVCDPMIGCVGPPCRERRDCDDGRFCNGVEECREGTCVPGTPPSCDDGVPCTVDACSERAGGCVSTPDSSRCPVGEICDPSSGDPDGCVVRRCRPGSRDCDDGFLCNGMETCGRDGRCIPGTPLACDDGDPCTIDRCEEGFGCIGEPPSPFESCGNGIDDDCDRQIDCADLDCRGSSGCPTCVPRSPTEVDCFDRIDDDCDARTDCDDSDCARLCMRVEICDDRIDNDGDGRVDCADPDCRMSPRCAIDAGPARAELGIAACTNGVDDDGDGRVDCADTDCTPLPRGECCNGIDDNRDGLIDIATCRCFDDALCVGVGNLDQVCWEDSFSVCLPRCNFYGSDAFCRMWFPDLPRCNRMTGECMR